MKDKTKATLFKNNRRLRLLALTLAVTLFASLLALPPAETAAASATPVSEHGALSVNGTQLVDQHGKPLQLRGVSTHGLQWFSQYNTKDTYQTLRDDWGANCIRLAMYTDQDGYCTGNKAKMEDEVTKGVQYATELGMYVIIDWHVLNDQNPLRYQSQATEFFSDVASKYQGYNNVIYEICNEPNNCSWTDIKSYATDVIRTIRERDGDAVIIVGTPNWSQLGSQGHIYEPVDDPIQGYENLMYAFHFYTSDRDHNQWIKEKLGVAIDRGLPVFVSEFGLSEANGDGTVDTAKAEEWLSMCDSYQVSYCVWSLSNDWRSSSLIQNSSNRTSNWDASELTTAGNFIRDWYRAKAEVGSGAGKNLLGVQGRAEELTHIALRLGRQLSGGLSYRTYVQGSGWLDWKTEGQLGSAEQRAKSPEAIELQLTGAAAEQYDIYYRVSVQTYGWLDWAKNGETAGAEGPAQPMQAIKIRLVPKGGAAPGSTDRPAVQK